MVYRAGKKFRSNIKRLLDACHHGRGETKNNHVGGKEKILVWRFFQVIKHQYSSRADVPLRAAERMERHRKLSRPLGPDGAWGKTSPLQERT